MRPVRCLVGLLLLAGLAQADDWVPPLTSEGFPDLQGTWTSATITTLERPRRFKQLVITEEEARQWEVRNAEGYAAIDDVPESGVESGGDVGGYNSFWMDPGTRVMRVNGELRTSQLIVPEDGQLPWRLGARLKLGAFLMRLQGSFDGPEQRPLGERCLVGFGSTGGPPMLPVLYNNNYQIVQTKDHVMILVEMNHDVRIIRIGGTHAPSNVRPWLGDSIGAWEDKSLVVNTQNFHPGQSFREDLSHSLYMTREAKVTERFTRVSADEILYRFEVDDPGAYTQTWIGELTLRRTQDRIYEYACHEGNYSLPGILAGARREEKEGKGEEGSGE